MSSSVVLPIFRKQCKYQIAGETQSRAVTLVAGRGSSWHGTLLSICAETLVTPVTGKECIRRKMAGIRLKLADAVDKDRCCIGDESPSAGEGFQD